MGIIIAAAAALGVVRAAIVGDEGLAGLKVLRDALTEWGIKDVLYGYKLFPKGHIRGDAIFMTTLPDDLMAIYGQDGGVSNDIIANSIEDIKEPFHLDIRAMVDSSADKISSQQKFLRALLDKSYSVAWANPSVDVDQVGFGSLTMFEGGTACNLIDPSNMLSLAGQFHKTIKENGQLGAHFGVTLKEAKVLYKLSQGKVADDIASDLGISRRTVETRLSTARKILLARTSTEAVYKASAYGLLPLK